MKHTFKALAVLALTVASTAFAQVPAAAPSSHAQHEATAPVEPGVSPDAAPAQHAMHEEMRLMHAKHEGTRAKHQSAPASGAPAPEASGQ